MTRFLAALLLVSGVLFGECRGKIDIGPVLMKVELLKFGKPEQTYHMNGVRGALDYFVYKPVFVRLTGISTLGKHRSHFQTYTAGVGACIPYCQFYFTPSVGVSYSHFKARNGQLTDFQLFNLKQEFTGLGPYVGFEVLWKITETWRVGGGFQYSWSNTRSSLEDVFSHAKGNSQGPTWTFLLEKDINQQWSINFGAAYNRSLDREKHGLRAQGIKVGLTYWL